MGLRTFSVEKVLGSFRLASGLGHIQLPSKSRSRELDLG